MSVTVKKVKEMKAAGERISMLTAYDYPTAALVDKAGCEIILVGDSLGNVVLGYENTTKVTMDDMVRHTAAVARAAKSALVVADMPFLAAHTGASAAVSNAGRLISEGGAAAVKLEGGREIKEQVRAIIAAGIPVMGHLGLLPQSVNVYGGYPVQGRTEEEAQKIVDDALVLERAGVFSIVVECVPKELGVRLSRELSVPIIGIGAGAQCDGQVLVLHDMLGLYQGKTAKFVKKYADLSSEILGALQKYVDEVKGGEFPDEEHSF